MASPSVSKSSWLSGNSEICTRTPLRSTRRLLGLFTHRDAAEERFLIAREDNVLKYTGSRFKRSWGEKGALAAPGYFCAQLFVQKVTENTIWLEKKINPTPKA